MVRFRDESKSIAHAVSQSEERLLQVIAEIERKMTLNFDAKIMSLERKVSDAQKADAAKDSTTLTQVCELEAAPSLFLEKAHEGIPAQSPLEDNSPVIDIHEVQSKDQSKNPPEIGMSSFHLAIMYYCTDPGRPLLPKMAWLFGGILLVVAQAICASALLGSVLGPTCTSRRQCQGGFACSIVVEDAGFCYPCLDPIFPSGFSQKLGHDNLTAICELNPDNDWCVACLDDNTFVDLFDDSAIVRNGYPLILKENVQAMHFSTWCCFIFATFCLAMVFDNEVFDIVACVRMMRKETSMFVRVLLKFNFVIRVGVFLLTTQCVPTLLVRGSSPMDIFFNTLGVTFMMDVDDSIYDIFFSQQVRDEIESADALLVDSSAWKAIRMQCLLIVVLSVLYMWSYTILVGVAPLVVQFIPFYAFVLGLAVTIGVFELYDVGNWKQKCCRCGLEMLLVLCSVPAMTSFYALYNPRRIQF